MKINKYNARHWVLLAKQALFTCLVILCRPFRHKPAVPIVVLYGHQFAGNLKALYEKWQDEFQSAFSVYFLTLDDQHIEQLARSNVQVLCCNRLRDMLVLSRTSAMVTDHGLHTMELLLRFTSIKFIDVWHGIPFKGFTPADFKLQHRYDEVWVSSPLLKDMYVDRFGFSAEKVKSLGYARTDQLFRRPAKPSAFRSEAKIPEDRKLVLYAPTWRQDDKGRELFPFGASQSEFTAALVDSCVMAGARLVIRAHLNASINSGKGEEVLYCPQKDYPDTEDLLLATDILVCDWSSIAFDFLALRRPILFLDVPAPFKHGFSLGPEYRFGCIIQNLDELKEKLHEYLLAPAAYQKHHALQEREATTALYENFTDGGSAARQMQRLKELLANVVG